MNVSDFDFDLPAGLIAQAPAAERGASRAARARTKSERRRSEHTHVSRLAEFLREGDLLVVNDTRVFPARLLGARVPSGGAVECLLLANLEDKGPSEGRWDALVHPGQKLQPGARMIFRGTAARAARRSSRAPLPRAAHDSALVRQRRERRGRHRRHRPHAAAAVYQARGHDERSRSVSDRVCARARFCRGADGRAPFHA